MEANIFAAEINLNFASARLQHQIDFNNTQVRAYLGGLSACYDEVLILCRKEHVAVWAVGKSSAMLVQALNNFMEEGMMKVETSTQASTSLFLKIVKGERWKNVQVSEIGSAIEDAIVQSVESDCFGQVLSKLTQQGLEANQLVARPYTWQDRRLAVVKYPTMVEFDFNRCSLN